MATAFDRALELDELRRAGETYAARYGAPGSAGHRVAWLRFRAQIKTVEDLQQRRRTAARARRKRPV